MTNVFKNIFTKKTQTLELELCQMYLKVKKSFTWNFCITIRIRTNDGLFQVRLGESASQGLKIGKRLL